MRALSQCLISWAIVVSLPSVAVGAPSVTAGIDAATQARVIADYGALPMAFEPNWGQAGRAVKFLARGHGYGLELTPTEAMLRLRGKAEASLTQPATLIRMRLVGANRRPQLSGMDVLPGTSSYFIGNDPARWRSAVPNYAKVRYAGVYPGIDLVYYGKQRQLEYDFVVAPGADPKRIVLEFEGTKNLALDAEGNLVLATAIGDLMLRKPVIYQDIHSVRQTLDGRYRLRGQHRASLEIARYDPMHPLVIDPILVYSTYLGGNGEDRVQGIALDGDGNAYVTGSSYRDPYHNFPTTPGAYQTTFGGSPIAFVAKLNATGTALLYSTYLGGTGYSWGYAIAVDGNRNAYVTGHADRDFPTTPGAYQTTFGGAGDAFVTKLDTTGTALVYSSYLGGTGNEVGQGIAVDGGGNAYVTGIIWDGNFPTTTGAFQSTSSGGSDAFVAKLNATGASLIYSTLLGGAGEDGGRAIAVDGSGNAHVTGYADRDFPTTRGAYQTTFGGASDAFVTKLDTTGTALVYSTYLGGTGNDSGYGIALDGSGSAYVTGSTEGAFPMTPGAFQTTFGGVSDAFATKLNAAGTALVYSTYLGNTGQDHGYAIAVDSSGNAYVTGYADRDFPTTPGAYQSGGGAFVTRLNATGTSLVYSTYLGGIGGQFASAIAVDGNGNAYVAGLTVDFRFPTTPGAYQTTFGGIADAFVTKLAEVWHGASAMVEGLWWKSPPNSESGWGINLAHQGEVIFATWYTYDFVGRAWWLTMTAYQSAENAFSGPLFETTGPAFGADPFNPSLVTRTPVGIGRLTFSDANNGSFAYTVYGISQTKSITRQVFGPLPTCVWGAQPNLALATNYQDLWWAAPAGIESGWGVNLTHQGDTIFATWFTYGIDGKPLWLSATTPRTALGTYTGTLYRTTGPDFNVEPFDPTRVTRTPVGTLTISFANGNAGSYAYTVTLPGASTVTQTKPITRQVFRTPGTVCQ